MVISYLLKLIFMGIAPQKVDSLFHKDCLTFGEHILLVALPYFILKK